MAKTKQQIEEINVLTTQDFVNLRTCEDLKSTHPTVQLAISISCFSKGCKGFKSQDLGAEKVK